MATVVTRWNPRREFVSLRDAMDRLFDESLVQPSWTALARQPEMGAGTWRLPLDVYATPAEFVITASVPGVSPENVEITFEGDALTLRGEFPAGLENVEYLVRERRQGRFSRSLSFNVPVNPDAIEATFEHGLLTVIVPKAEEVKPKTIKVVAK